MKIYLSVITFLIFHCSFAQIIITDNDLISVGDIIEQVDIQTKYQSYIDKEKEMVEQMKALENKKIDPKINYNNVFSLSSEGKDKLIKLNLQP